MLLCGLGSEMRIIPDILLLIAVWKTLLVKFEGIIIHYSNIFVCLACVKVLKQHTVFICLSTQTHHNLRVM